jgi:endoglucanase
VDEIGLIVTRIDDKGFLRCTNIGGWDVAVLVGQRVRVIGPDGPVLGSIGRPAVHVLDAAAKDKVPKLKDLWIDIGAESGDEARERVRVGNPVVIDAAPMRLGEHRIVSRSLDDRVGAFVALEAARELKADAGGFGGELVAIGSTAEEIGAAGALTAAFGSQPDVAIAIDVTTPSCTPGGNDTGDLSLGKGPIITRGATTNVEVVDSLIEVAEAHDIPYQLRGMGARTRTDADAIARAGAGVPVGLLSVPARYLHSPCEHADLRDVRATIDLLTAWVRSR